MKKIIFMFLFFNLVSVQANAALDSCPSHITKKIKANVDSMVTWMFLDNEKVYLCDEEKKQQTMFYHLSDIEDVKMDAKTRSVQILMKTTPLT